MFWPLQACDGSPIRMSEYIFNAETTLISGLCECDDFEAARKAFRTYQPELVKYARDSVGQARLLSLEAALFYGRRKYAAAENLFLKAIALMEKTPGASPVELAVDREHLIHGLQQRRPVR